MRKINQFYERNKKNINISILCLVMLVFIIFSRKLALVLFIDNETGLIDRQLLWSAIGSTATFLAVFVALFQHNYNNSKRLKLSLNKSTVVNANGYNKEFLDLCISNTGVRSVNIQSWRLIIKKQHFLLFPQNPMTLTTENMPIALLSEESHDLYFPIENLKLLLKDDYDLNAKIDVYVIDSVGARYYLKTKMTLKYFFE